MPNNQRENARKARKRNKEQKIQRIIWSIIILVVAILIVMKVVEVDFNSVKKRFVDDGGKLNVTEEIEVGAYPYQLDSSKNVNVVIQGDKLNALTGTSCSILNPKDAKQLYTFEHGYANPIVSTAGNYFCTFDQGATRFRLDTLQKKIYEQTLDAPVLCADVSKTGSVIYASASKDNKSTLTVVNKSLKKVLKKEVNSGYIVAVAIDSDGKRCAYATINSKDAKLLTTVYTINVCDEADRASFEFKSGNILDLNYCGKDLYFVADNGVYTIINQKKQKEAFKSGSANTVCFGYTKEDELIYVYSDYSAANENHLVTVKPSGRKGKSIELNKRPKYVSSNGNEICVLFTNTIKIYSISGGADRGTYKCDDGVQTAHKLSSRVFVSKGQQLDIIEQSANK